MKIYLANEILCKIMESQNLNATDIVEKTGWNATKVSRIINCQRELTGSEIQNLSNALQIPVSNFFNDVNIVADEAKEELAKLLKTAGSNFANEKNGEYKGAKVGELIRKKLPAILKNKAKINDDYIVEGSIGKGQFAEVPWVAIFDKEITNSATKGIYIVFLYSVQKESVYLSLNQGYTYFSDKFAPKEARKEIIKMADLLRNRVIYNNQRFKKDINLGATKALGRGYEAGHIIGIEYNFSNMPSDPEILKDIFDLMVVYKSIHQMFNNRTVEEFYDFLVAEEHGLIKLHTVEEEVNTENVIEVEEKNVEIVDVPQNRKEAVFDDKGKKRFPRDPQVAARALDQGHYSCTYSNDHHTFIAKGSSHMYVEAHHLIPMKESDKFVNSIDVEANIVSLCSVCHDCIHHGTDQDKYKLINELYKIRKNRLEQAGIFVTLEQLLGFYSITTKFTEEN